MIYAVTTVEHLRAVGVDTTHLRKSLDGTMAIIHREFLDPLIEDLTQHPETVLYEYRSKALETLLSSPAWTTAEAPDISEAPAAQAVFTRSMAAGVQRAAMRDMQSGAPGISDRDIAACKEIIRAPWTDAGYTEEDVGRIVEYGGQLYRVLLPVPAGLDPPDVTGMWPYYRLVQPDYAGTIEDPIPLIITGSGTMLTKDFYYSYGGQLYRALVDEYLCVYDPEMVIGTVFERAIQD